MILENVIPDEEVPATDVPDSRPPGGVTVPGTSSDEALERLHGGGLSAITGNLDGENTFKDWHEVVTVPSYLEQPLQLLPYVILDF